MVFAMNSWSTAFTKCVSANHTNVYETSFIFGEWLHWLLEYEKRLVQNILWHTIELKVLQYYSFTKLHAKFDLAWTYWLIRMHHISLARICSQAWPEIKLFQKDRLLRFKSYISSFCKDYAIVNSRCHYSRKK